MSNLFLTLMIAFIVIVFAIACLAIGWLITGKTKLEKACGRDPTKKKDSSCESSPCTLCDSSKAQSPHVHTDSESEENETKE